MDVSVFNQQVVLSKHPSTYVRICMISKDVEHTCIMSKDQKPTCMMSKDLDIIAINMLSSTTAEHMLYAPYTMYPILSVKALL